MLRMTICSLMLAVAGLISTETVAQVSPGTDKPVVLTRPETQSLKAHFVEAEFLPEQGMTLIQI
jgi:hypothetical protein